MLLLGALFDGDVVKPLLLEELDELVEFEPLLVESLELEELEELEDVVALDALTL